MKYTHHHMIAEHVSICAHFIAIAARLGLPKGPFALLTELDRLTDLKTLLIIFSSKVQHLV